MKNLSIGKKFLSVFALIFIFYLFTVFCNISSLGKIGANFDKFYTGPYFNTTYTISLQKDIAQASNYISYAALTEDPIETQKYLDQADASLNNMKEGMDYLKKNFSDNPQLVKQIDDLMSSSISIRNNIFTLLKNNETEEGFGLYLEQLLPKYEQVNTLLNQINELALQNGDNYYSSSSKNIDYTVIFMYILSGVTLLFAIGLALYLTKSIVSPIQEINTAATLISQGILNAEIQYQSKDELGTLSNSIRGMVSFLSNIISDLQFVLAELSRGNFTVQSHNTESYIGEFAPLLTSIRQMRDDINSTLIHINQSADQVSSGSDQVSSGAQALAQGATEQASSVEELAATITEVSSQIQNTAENAEAAQTLTEQNRQEVNTCNMQMQEMTSAMEAISETSSEISKIIKTIEDIAFQTNILALNAAVEAARAGAAGKGFAVVADEVRNLASKSAEASKNTSVLIENSLTAVEKGIGIVHMTAASLSNVVGSTNQVSDMVEKISSAAARQAASVSQINQGIDQISSVVQTNSATAEQSAAASQQLSSQANLLKQLIEKFHLQNDSALQLLQETDAITPMEPDEHFTYSNDKY